MSGMAWNLGKIEERPPTNQPGLFRPGTALACIAVIMLVALARGPEGPRGILAVTTAMIGGHWAMNIGTNDGAAHVGPFAGDDAVGPIRNGIPYPGMICFVLRGALLP